jgi:ComF family protein
MVSRPSLPLSLQFYHQFSGGEISGEGKILIWSDGLYRPPLSNAILSLKYRPNRQLSDFLAGRLAEIYGGNIKADLLTIIPLGQVRQRQRGYNQVDLIARPLARKTGISYRHNALIRIRETVSQVGLQMDERQKNVRDAFQADPETVLEKHVLLLDDVVTTGATLKSAAGALFRAGARSVTGLTIARAKFQSAG